MRDGSPPLSKILPALRHQAWPEQLPTRYETFDSRTRYFPANHYTRFDGAYENYRPLPE